MFPLMKNLKFGSFCQLVGYLVLTFATFQAEAQILSSYGPSTKNLQTAAQLSNSSVPLGSVSSALSTVEVVGNKFFTVADGKQFFIKGIAYQPSKVAGDVVALDSGNDKFIDPLAELAICLRDLPYLQKLGVNTVRVYSIDTDRDHDDCFDAFAKAGIYVIADLSEPDVSIVRDSPAWDITTYERYTKVVDALHKYPNLLGFFAGNEVTNDKTNTFASPFVKSSIRDAKNYIKTKNYRQIPVGYSTNDDADTRANVADFFACGDVAADFYGINMYEWCGYSTYWASGYKDRTEEFKNYPVPVFFSEFGCNVKRPRPFTEVEALYSRMMTNVWSGGIAYMYFEEPNQYGVVKVKNGIVQELEDFAYLQKQFNDANPKGVSLEEFKTTLKAARAPSCPSASKVWQASSVLPHSPDLAKCECLESSLQCGLSQHVKSNNLTHIFDYACDKVDCEPINGDGIKGSYGYFSDCSARQKASYVINELYLKLGAKKDTCDFDGLAVLNHKVATESEMDSVSTLSGDSCLEVIKANNLKKALQKSMKVNNQNHTSTRNSSSQFGHGFGDSENAASQVKFYQNLSSAVLLSFVFVIILSLFE